MKRPQSTHSFRTAVHRPLDQSEPKRPPSFETAYRETPLDRPSYAVEASDRTYVTTADGSIRRVLGGRRRRRAEKTETSQKAKAWERIEAELQKRDRRRIERLQASAERLRKRAAAVITKTKKALTLRNPAGAVRVDPPHDGGVEWSIIDDPEIQWSGKKLYPVEPAATLQGETTVAEMLLEDRE